MISGKKANCIYLNDQYYLKNDEKKIDYVYKTMATEDFVEDSKNGTENHPYPACNIESTLLISTKHIIDFSDKQVELPFGSYMFKMESYPAKIIAIPISEIYSDKYVNLNSESTAKIGTNLEKFLSLEDMYEKLHLIHKRGYLLYGPPGNGKTMLIKRIIDEYQDLCYIFYIRESTNWEKLSSIRSVFKDSIVFFIIEELTLQTSKSSVEELLNFLDGPFSWNNCVIFATTNSPELLPNNVIDRPSRFDMVVKFDNPTDDCRRQYITHMLGKCSDQIVRLSQGHSLAYLKELCLMSLIYDDFDVSKYGNNFKDFQNYVESTKTKHYI